MYYLSPTESGQIYIYQQTTRGYIQEVGFDTGCSSEKRSIFVSPKDVNILDCSYD